MNIKQIHADKNRRARHMAKYEIVAKEKTERASKTLRTRNKIGRNLPCPCGKMKEDKPTERLKYKNCCGG
jgi:uncharacterized protein YecA (UPF0149 family)